MYIAELQGKLSSRLEKMEDVLTSNVFSFFKYARRDVYLKSLFEFMDIEVSKRDLERAKFIFWPNYDDRTEPDLVIIAGGYYLLFEAKYFSGFAEETHKAKSQLLREINGGLNEAKALGKEFVLIVITADYYYKPSRFSGIPKKYSDQFIWLNWQTVCALLLSLLGKYGNKLPDFLFTKDLCSLLERKNLRSFRSFEGLSGLNVGKAAESLFFSKETASFRGAFIGFSSSLLCLPTVSQVSTDLFYSRIYFSNLELPNIEQRETFFYKKGDAE